jgi:hypothetical protein
VSRAPRRAVAAGREHVPALEGPVSTTFKPILTTQFVLEGVYFEG